MMVMQRIRFTYTKGEPLKWIGHLDLARVWERVLRRTQLPVAYTKGFNPQLRIQFASALPVGCRGRAELADLWLNEPIAPAQFAAELQPKLPPGIEIRDIHEVDLHAPTLQALMWAADYVVQILPEGAVDVAQAVGRFTAATQVLKQRARDGKTYDLRPLIEDLRVEGTDDEGWVHLALRVSSRPGATGRPDELLEVLGLTDCARRIERTQLILAAEPDKSAGTPRDADAALAFDADSEREPVAKVLPARLTRTGWGGFD
ncbi:MAG: TIGR03936 family radical SAM-associated protein [Anaerolineae bacterium]